MTGLYNDAFVDELRRGALGLVAEWGLSTRTTVRLLEISENATFRADDPATGGTIILRVHRPGYRTLAEVASELAWIHALRQENVVAIPEPLQRRNGEFIAQFPTHAGVREVVAFEFMSGQAPSPTEDLVASFQSLGAINAHLHQHAQTWEPPPGFTRKTWNFATTIGNTPLWGDWRAGLGLTVDGQAILEQAVVNLEHRLLDYGQGRARFGLIHADLRLANLLIDGERIAVIDFDDCGFGWYGFDFAAAVSFFETDPQIPALMLAWIDGYRSVAPLSETDAAMLPVFVMLRRIQLTAWIASHAETPTAQRMGPEFTTGTVRMAEAFIKEYRL